MKEFQWWKAAPKAAELKIQATKLYEQAAKMLTERAELLLKADKELRKVLPEDPFVDAAPRILHAITTVFAWARHPQPKGVSFSHHNAITVWLTDWVRFSATPHNPGTHHSAGLGILRLSLVSREIPSLRDPASGPAYKPLLSIGKWFGSFKVIVADAVKLEKDPEYRFASSWEHEDGFAVTVYCRLDSSILVGGEKKEHAIIPEGWE